MLAAYEIPVAVISATAIIAGASIPAWITHKRLGKPNGGGTVVGEIAQVKAEVVKAVSAAAEARAHAATASTAAQLAASFGEANGNKIEELAGRVKMVETEVGLVPRHPF